MRRRKSNQLILFMIVICVLLVCVFVAIKALSSSPAEQAKDVVHEFYSYEQVADFASSWSLFHSSMKEKFTKSYYIQDRAHVFMNHFGVETFSYTVSDQSELKKWKMSKDSSPFSLAYVFTVVQTYKGKYGNFDIEQEVFVVKEKDQWRVLWDYNQ
jgi:hypothetical protein